jgi:hypothetical protein
MTSPPPSPLSASVVVVVVAAEEEEEEEEEEDQLGAAETDEVIQRALHSARWCRSRLEALQLQRALHTSAAETGKYRYFKKRVLVSHPGDECQHFNAIYLSALYDQPISPSIIQHALKQEQNNALIQEQGGGIFDGFCCRCC